MPWPFPRAPSGAAPDPVPDPAQVAALAARLRAGGRQRPGRTLTVLHVPTGGCGGCALEFALLAGAPCDAGRFGIAVTGNPRHADVLLVTGPVGRNAAGAVLRAWDAMPGPAYAVAIGDCAAGGGPFADGPDYATEPGGLGRLLPVDLVIRGAPPPPAQILLGLLTLLEAVVPSPREAPARDPSAAPPPRLAPPS